MPHLQAAVGELGDTGFFTRRVGLETVCVARQLGTYPIQALGKKWLGMRVANLDNGATPSD